jgi:hypothetical protein
MHFLTATKKRSNICFIHLLSGTRYSPKANDYSNPSTIFGMSKWEFYRELIYNRLVSSPLKTKTENDVNIMKGKFWLHPSAQVLKSVLKIFQDQQLRATRTLSPYTVEAIIGYRNIVCNYWFSKKCCGS